MCSEYELFFIRTTVKTTVILLPLLGLTWIVGPFLLLKNTDMLSWSFAILNSLQVDYKYTLLVLQCKQCQTSV